MMILYYWSELWPITNKLIRIRNLETAIMRVIYHVIRHINKAISFAESDQLVG